MEKPTKDLTLPQLIEYINNHHQGFLDNGCNSEQVKLFEYASELGSRLSLPAESAAIYAKIFYRSVYGYFPEKAEAVQIISHLQIVYVHMYLRILQRSGLVQFSVSKESYMVAFWISLEDEDAIMGNVVPDVITKRLPRRFINLVKSGNEIDYDIYFENKHIIGKAIRDFEYDGVYEVVVGGEHIMSNESVKNIIRSLNEMYFENKLKINLQN